MTSSAANPDPMSAGNSAPRLAVAPPELRCQFQTGPNHQCSRFTLKGDGTRREVYCLAHSRSARAKDLKVKALKGQRAVAEAEARRLRRLSIKLLPRVWDRRSAFQKSRFKIHRALVAGQVTPQQANALCAIVRDAEQHARLGRYDWPETFPE